MGAAATAVLALPAFGQAGIETVTVTGTLIQGNTNLVSPVTVIDTSTLDKSGISSIQTALQTTLANNGPAVTNSWTANGNFAQGASGISLRGLTTNSTLVLFDGMRSAYYPLSDDGIRNFVDLNTIPDDIVENIQVLRDGASSSYGADAIAGVVNIITKKEFQGFSARAEGGIADRGDAASWKFSAIGGTGDLEKDHVNFYLSASYYHSDPLHDSSRPYPFNSSDFSKVCYTNPDPNYGPSGTNCGSFAYNPVVNAGTNADGSLALSALGNFLVRPGTVSYDPTDNHTIITPVAGSRYQALNSNCGRGKSYTLTAADKAGSGAIDPDAVCQYDYNNLWGAIEPMVTRFALSGHSAFNLPNGFTGYVEANYMQDEVGYATGPSTYTGNAPTGIYYPRFSTSAVHSSSNALSSYQLYLPTYVCAARVNCDTATDRKLNPNNPFAGQVDSSGNPIVARLFGSDPTTQTFEQTRDRTYRVAAELNGTILNDVTFNLGMTATHIDLRRLDRGYVYIQHLLDVVADGTYNFLDPSKNSAAIKNYLMPDNVTNDTSDLAQAKFSVTVPLYKLPGGDLTLVGGTSISYEAVDAPSSNSDINGPTQRYFVLNAFGTKGSRDVYSGFFELNAPIIEEFVINASGRYDSYSSGQSNFSPKIGFWSRPIDQVTFKGTYSQGFRIPSFAEANALPTTGYVTNTKTPFNDTYLAQYGCSLATYASCPTYITKGAYGQTTLASPNLQPEKSRSWVFDLTYQPIESLTLQTTYYNIKKTGAIVTPSSTDALVAYYAGQPIPAGFNVVPGTPSLSYPNAKPVAGFVEAQLINANTVRTAGWDFDVIWDQDLDGIETFLGVMDTIGSVHLNSDLQATFIQNLDTKFPDGHIERYDGTLGNYSLTAGTGTPKWRGRWQSTFTASRIEFTSTLNWNSGYNLSAMDSGTGYRDCGISDGSVPCRTADYFTWDVNTQYKATDNIKVYFTVNNVLDAMPPVDTWATYGSTGYNVVVGGDGILGRYLKFGVKLDY